MYFCACTCTLHLYTMYMHEHKCTGTCMHVCVRYTNHSMNKFNVHVLCCVYVCTVYIYVYTYMCVYVSTDIQLHVLTDTEYIHIYHTPYTCTCTCTMPTGAWHTQTSSRQSMSNNSFQLPSLSATLPE